MRTNTVLKEVFCTDSEEESAHDGGRDCDNDEGSARDGEGDHSGAAGRAHYCGGTHDSGQLSGKDLLPI